MFLGEPFLLHPQRSIVNFVPLSSKHRGRGDRFWLLYVYAHCCLTSSKAGTGTACIKKSKYRRCIRRKHGLGQSKSLGINVGVGDMAQRGACRSPAPSWTTNFTLQARLHAGYNSTQAWPESYINTVLVLEQGIFVTP